MKPMISIVTVNYNGGEVIHQCLKRIAECINTDHEVVVFDNASTDGSCNEIHSDDRQHLILGKENYGFAKGNNLAAATAKAEWMHFMNPDILVNELLDGSYKQVLSDGHNIMYVTSLKEPDGTLNQMSMLIPTLPNYWNRMFRRQKTLYWSIGASIIIHRDTFWKLGGWSEEYFMYSEDLDLFYKAQKVGVKVKILDTGIVHIGKVSSRSAWSAGQRAVVIEKSFKTFFRKHRSIPEYYAVRILQFVYQLLFNRSELKYGFNAFLKLLLK